MPNDPRHSVLRPSFALGGYRAALPMVARHIGDAAISLYTAFRQEATGALEGLGRKLHKPVPIQLEAVRIMYLNPIGAIGGAEKCLLDILETVQSAEPDWRLGLITGSPGPLASRAEALGVAVTVLSLPPSIAKLGDGGGGRPRSVLFRISYFRKVLYAGMCSVPYIFRLIGAVREFRPDLIHTNGFKMHVLGLWSRPGRIPVVWHIHDYVCRRPMMKRLLRLHRPLCSAAIANSQSVLRDVQIACGPKLKACCVYNAIDLTNFSPLGERQDLDAPSGLAPAEPGVVRIGLLATMARWKGHTVFLKALARLPSDLPYRAYVIGGPIYNTEDSQYTIEELRALASELHIADRIVFTGFLANPAAAIRALDIVVHASTEPEPFGLVIAEAMACARPVISSATGGAGELVTEGRDALSHPPGDDLTLAKRMVELAENPDFRHRIGTAARTTSERRFERSRLAAELIPLYRRVISKTFQSNPE